MACPWGWGLGTHMPNCPPPWQLGLSTDLQYGGRGSSEASCYYSGSAWPTQQGCDLGLACSSPSLPSQWATRAAPPQSRKHHYELLDDLGTARPDLLSSRGSNCTSESKDSQGWKSYRCLSYAQIFLGSQPSGSGTLESPVFCWCKNVTVMDHKLKIANDWSYPSLYTQERHNHTCPWLVLTHEFGRPQALPLQARSRRASDYNPAMCPIQNLTKADRGFRMKKLRTRLVSFPERNYHGPFAFSKSLNL